MPRPMSSLETKVFAKWLEWGGYTKAVAGAKEWAAAFNAAKTALENRRGLLVFGKTGRGKTCLLRSLEKYISKGLKREAFWLYTKDGAAMRWMADDEASRILLKRTVFIDDIGAEEVVVDYGNRKDVVGDFVQRYHERGEGLLFGSTNLSSIDLNQRYGTRVLSRLVSMCVCFKMDGEDKRERMVCK